MRVLNKGAKKHYQVVTVAMGDQVPTLTLLEPPVFEEPVDDHCSFMQRYPIILHARSHLRADLQAARRIRVTAPASKPSPR